MEAQDAVRLHLESERAKLARELAALTLVENSGRAPESGYATHAADHGSDMYAQEQSLAIRRHVQGGLEQVERALRKLGDGTYGRCERCSRTIDRLRLEALPQAALCLACQSEQEGRH